MEGKLMLFNNLQKLQLDEQTAILRQNIISPPKQREEIKLEKFRDLFNIQEETWDKIKWSFINNFRNFDKLLLSIHYKRHEPLDFEQREIVLRFLTIGYLLSNDVRFFNEFLWFNRISDHPLMILNLYNFRENMLDGKYHKFPLASIKDVQDWVRDINSISDNAPPKNKSMNIGLLGTPKSFSRLYRVIKDRNFYAKVFYFPTYANTVKRFIGSNKFLLNLFLYSKGCYIPYTTIKNAPRDEQIKDKLKRENLDIAMHRLGFIIKNNIIGAFNIGILNDHLAVLPFIRGRSSVEYSLLFGFPIGATIHLVDEGVDTGGIISVFTYPILHHNTEQIKKDILENSDSRFINAIDYITQRDYKIVANPYEKGLQYYVMHPELMNFINQVTLKP